MILEARDRGRGHLTSRCATEHPLCGGLAIAATDLVYCVLYWSSQGVAPARLLQGIAAGALGKAAFHGGIATAVLGAGFQWLIGCCFVFAYALGAGNVDTVQDFVSGADRLALDHGIFTGLSTGVLSSNAFVMGTAAQDADDRILYDSASGNLYFDADGNGAGAAVLFATLQGHPTLIASDIVVI